MPVPLDVLIPTVDRPTALAVTLSGIAAQSAAPQRVLVADQSASPVAEDPVVAAMLRVLEANGTAVQVVRRRERRGIAEQRAFLLEESTADRVLMLDDDVWLTPWALGVLHEALESLGCGLVGMPVIGLSYLHDIRPHEWRAFEAWDGPVVPERVRREDPAWQRHQLHNAANPWHLAQALGATPQRWLAYRIAWVGGCALFNRTALRASGGFDFWRQLPVPHVGEDVVAQLRTMERFGAAGVLPSGAIHLELPTTLRDRSREAYDVIGLSQQPNTAADRV